MSEERASRPNLSSKNLREGADAIRSYLRNAKLDDLTPTDYQNPFTRQPFEDIEQLRDYWSDLLDQLPPQNDLGPDPK